jgi:membrane protein implicated in regulation of membrane protease activity
LTATLLATLASRFLLLLAGLLLAWLLLSAALLTALSTTLVLATLAALSALLATLARILICHWNRSPRGKSRHGRTRRTTLRSLGLPKEIFEGKDATLADADHVRHAGPTPNPFRIAPSTGRMCAAIRAMKEERIRRRAYGSSASWHGGYQRQRIRRHFP